MFAITEVYHHFSNVVHVYDFLVAAVRPRYDGRTSS